MLQNFNFLELVKNRLCIFFIMCSLMTFSGCQKDISHDSKIEENVETKIFKQIYEKESKPISATYSQKSDLNLVFNTENFLTGNSPDWSLYKLVIRANSRVTQFDIKDDSVKLAFRKNENGREYNYRSKTKLVFIENLDGTRINFIMKIVEQLDSFNPLSEINNTFYNHIPIRFHGSILYFTLRKEFINGYRFESGEAVRQIKIYGSLNKNQTTGSQYKVNKEENSGNCELSPIYNVWCEWAISNGEYDDHGCHITQTGTELLCPITTGDIPAIPGGGVTGDGGYTNNGYSPIKVNKSDQSVKANPKVDCILGKFDDTNSAYNKFLAAFIADNGYDVKFIVVPSIVDATGHQINAKTTYVQNSTNVTISFNANYFDNATVTDAGRTVIHEMVHVYLAQKILQAGGAGNLKNFVDLDGQSLFNYYTRYVNPNTGKITDVINNESQHDFMAENLVTDMAIGLKEFVEKNYIQTANDALITIDNYKAEIYSSLRETKGYSDYLKKNNQTDSTQDMQIQILKSGTSSRCN